MVREADATNTTSHRQKHQEQKSASQITAEETQTPLRHHFSFFPLDCFLWCYKKYLVLKKSVYINAWDHYSDVYPLFPLQFVPRDLFGLFFSFYFPSTSLSKRKNNTYINAWSHCTDIYPLFFFVIRFIDICSGLSFPFICPWLLSMVKLKNIDKNVSIFPVGRKMAGGEGGGGNRLL